MDEEQDWFVTYYPDTNIIKEKWIELQPCDEKTLSNRTLNLYLKHEKDVAGTLIGEKDEFGIGHLNDGKWNYYKKVDVLTSFSGNYASEIEINVVCFWLDDNKFYYTGTKDLRKFRQGTIAPQHNKKYVIKTDSKIYALVESWYKNRKRKEKYSYKYVINESGYHIIVNHGPFQRYYSDGACEVECNFVDGYLHGYYNKIFRGGFFSEEILFYQNGQRSCEEKNYHIIDKKLCHVAYHFNDKEEYEEVLDWGHGKKIIGISNELLNVKKLLEWLFFKNFIRKKVKQIKEKNNKKIQKWKETIKQNLKQFANPLIDIVESYLYVDNPLKAVNENKNHKEALKKYKQMVEGLVKEWEAVIEIGSIEGNPEVLIDDVRQFLEYLIKEEKWKELHDEFIKWKHVQYKEKIWIKNGKRQGRHFWRLDDYIKIHKSLIAKQPTDQRSLFSDPSYYDDNC